MNSKIIAVDFDGTLCENKWPEIGEANEDMIYYLRKRQAEGDKLILWTCRVGDMLRKAINWCYNYGLIFNAVNENLPEIIDSFGSDTRKIFVSFRCGDVYKMAGIRPNYYETWSLEADEFLAQSAAKCCGKKLDSLQDIARVIQEEIKEKEFNDQN